MPAARGVAERRGHQLLLQAPPGSGCGSKPMGSHFGEGALPILVYFGEGAPPGSHEKTPGPKPAQKKG